MENNKAPLISVVMPAYNSEKYINRTIQSVFEQTYKNWELLIIDDCSSDNTVQEASKWSAQDSRAKVIKLDKNFGGPAGPRNHGVKLARGKYIAFLDSDDIWHPNKLELQAHLIASKNALFVCSQMQDFTKEDDILFLPVNNIDFIRVNFIKQSIRSRIPTSSVMVARELLIKNLFYDDPEYKAVEDYHCWLRILEACKECFKITQPLLYYRRSPGQISGSKIYMIKKVFMVHKEYPGRSKLGAGLLTLSHVVGGLFRCFKKEM